MNTPAIYEELLTICDKIDRMPQPEFAFGLGLIAVLFIVISYIVDHQ